MIGEKKLGTFFLQVLSLASKMVSIEKGFHLRKFVGCYRIFISCDIIIRGPSKCLYGMSTKQMSFTITDQPVIINGTEHQVTAVNGMDRVLINNRLHDLGEQILKLRMQQDELAQMRNVLDHHVESKEEDLFEMFYAS